VQQRAPLVFARRGVVPEFKLKTTLPTGKPYRSVGRVYVTGNERKDAQRVHRIVADRSSGVYFGYDLIIQPSVIPGSYLISVRSLSKKLSDLLPLNGLNLTSGGKEVGPEFSPHRLPKYPDDITVMESDTVALDILYNPQTKTEIVDFIKIKRPQDFS
jgi:hypothetical protein